MHELGIRLSVQTFPSCRSKPFNRQYQCYKDNSYLFKLSKPLHGSTDFTRIIKKAAAQTCIRLSVQTFPSYSGKTPLFGSIVSCCTRGVKIGVHYIAFEILSFSNTSDALISFSDMLRNLLGYPLPQPNFEFYTQS